MVPLLNATELSGKNKTNSAQTLPENWEQSVSEFIQ